MGLADRKTANKSNNDKHMSLQQWEPDHEPPVDSMLKFSPKNESSPTNLSSQDPRPHSPPGLTSPLAPLNHHNQLTRFMAKQTLGYIPKLSNCSPENAGSSPCTSGVFNFDSPRAIGIGSPCFQLPSLGTPPLSPQKWTSPSRFEEKLSERTSLPALSQSGSNVIHRSGSLSESSLSPIPPLKRPHHETSHPMSIADLCQPFHYVRSSSCPSDTTHDAVGSDVTTPTIRPAIVKPSWRPAIEAPTFLRSPSSTDNNTLHGTLPHHEHQHHRLHRCSSMDAPTLMRRLKRSAAESIDLTQWLDRSNRSSLSSLADSVDSMHQLEQAGRSLRISDSPREDPGTPQEGKREKKLCMFPQCTSNAVTRGLCISHGGGRRCQRKDCTRGAQSKGLCVAHGGGRICRAAGCSNIQRSMGLCIRHGGGRRCSVKGCQKGVVRQDLCTAHGGKRKCRVPECTKHVKKKGLCRSHANSMYSTGSN